MQLRTPEGTVGSKTGLYDFVVGDGINVFMGCGLGGTSLVNANVSLEAEPRVFQDARWPAQVRQDLPTLVQQGYDHAREMLKPTPFPTSFPSLPKMGALEKSAQYLEQNFYRTPINVTFETKVNHVGVPQNACTMCGDCVTGCNYGAKNTTLMNYLPDARNFGAEIFTQVSVRYIERRDGKWFVHYQALDEGREDFNAPDLFVTADIVMLGAGTLGSTEILLRSKAQGLPLSDCLGERFSGNGDVLGFSYNGDREVNGIGFGHRKPGEIPPVGPCITGVIDIRNQPKLEDGMIVEEGSVPGALKSPQLQTQFDGALGAGAEAHAVQNVEILGALQGVQKADEALVVAFDALGDIHLHDAVRIGLVLVACRVVRAKTGLHGERIQIRDESGIARRERPELLVKKQIVLLLDRGEIFFDLIAAAKIRLHDFPLVIQALQFPFGGMRGARHVPDPPAEAQIHRDGGHQRHAHDSLPKLELLVHQIVEYQVVSETRTSSEP